MACAACPYHHFCGTRLVMLFRLALTKIFALVLLLGLPGTGLANAPEHDPPPNRTAGGGDEQTQEGPWITPTSAFNLAYNDYLSGRYELAVMGFRRFIADFPWSSLIPKAHFWVGESHYHREDFEQAIQNFEYLVREYPNHEMVPVVLYRLSLVTKETGDRAKSLRYWQRLINEFPTSNQAALVKTWMAETR